jgi:hypothetical protein
MMNATELKMSMSDLTISIQEDICMGVLSFGEIAERHAVPLSWVNAAWDLLCEQEAEAERYAGYSHNDEPGELDYNDNRYDEQYELDTGYV